MAEGDVADRLAAVGAALVFPRPGELADDVLAELDASGPAAVVARVPRRRVVLAVAAVLLAVVVAVAVIPGPRRAVARWLGFGAYRIEPVAELPAVPDLVDDGAAPAVSAPPASAADPAIGPGRLVARVDVDGTPVVVIDLPGELVGGSFGKFVGPRTTITVTTVGGAPAYWISGDDHLLVYRRGDDVREARLSADALVWERSGVIRRVEGEVTLAEALAVARDVERAEPGE